MSTSPSPSIAFPLLSREALVVCCGAPLPLLSGGLRHRERVCSHGRVVSAQQTVPGMETEQSRMYLKKPENSVSDVEANDARRSAVLA